jgi:hypothetical protein
MENAIGIKETDVLAAVRAGLEEAPATVRQLGGSLERCAAELRLGQPSAALAALTSAIGNLAVLAEFIVELRKGLETLGVNESGLKSWDGCRDAFREIVNALEKRDWVFLSDLIEYELCPALEQTGNGMSCLAERLAGAPAFSTHPSREVAG